MAKVLFISILAFFVIGCSYTIVGPLGGKHRGSILDPPHRKRSYQQEVKQAFINQSASTTPEEAEAILAGNWLEGMSPEEALVAKQRTRGMYDVTVHNGVFGRTETWVYNRVGEPGHTLFFYEGELSSVTQYPRSRY